MSVSVLDCFKSKVFVLFFCLALGCFFFFKLQIIGFGDPLGH